MIRPIMLFNFRLPPHTDSHYSSVFYNAIYSCDEFEETEKIVE